MVLYIADKRLITPLGESLFPHIEDILFTSYKTKLKNIIALTKVFGAG
jgi:hypothetical protein